MLHFLKESYFYLKFVLEKPNWENSYFVDIVLFRKNKIHQREHNEIKFIMCATVVLILSRKSADELETH